MTKGPGSRAFYRRVIAGLAACVIAPAISVADELSPEPESDLAPVGAPRFDPNELRKNLPALPNFSEAGPGDASCDSITQIEVFKYDRRLRAICSAGQVLEFRIALGRRPFGDKQRKGDLRTPEGYYRVAEPARASEYHVFIALDYPSVVDADQGLDRGDIDAQTYLEIVRAVLQGRLPPQDTPLGGAIGIHGEGEGRQGRSRGSDWTLGCIALDDRNARFIGDRVHVGTPVVIRP